MTAKGDKAKSIPEQIIEATLSKLEKSDLYDEVVLGKLKEVAAMGKLTSSKIVVDAISILKE